MSSYLSIFSNLDSTKSSSSSISSTIPSVGLTVAVKKFRIPSSLLFESSSGSVSFKITTSALLFPMVLRYVGHSYFMWPKPWQPKHFGPEGTVYWPPSLASFFPLSWLLNYEELDCFWSLSNPFALAFFINFLNYVVYRISSYNLHCLKTLYCHCS